jgi:hypothetical protein
MIPIWGTKGPFIRPRCIGPARSRTLINQSINQCLVQICGIIYRVIHKSLRDFRLLRYSSRDGHAEGEHVNRGRDTTIFCPTLQVLDMCKLGDAADVNTVIKFLRHALQCVRICIFVLNILLKLCNLMMATWWPKHVAVVTSFSPTLATNL